MKKDTMKFNSDFEKRLCSYSALAGAVLAIAPAADGGVIKQTDGRTNQTNFQIDLNGDGKSDVWIRSFDGTSYFLNTTNSGSGACLYQGGYIGALNLNDTIGASKSFADVAYLIYSGSGPWVGASNKYLGVRFKIGGSSGTTHYGWVEMTFEGGSFDLGDYAYETTPDLAIKAGSDQSLPVELASFSARYESGVVNLSWATESETDNLGYILERKTAGTDWQEIASYATDDELEGVGNTSSRTEYSFADDDVLPGETYTYRLSDVDTDGTVTVKDVISIELDEAPPETVLKPATPNPFNPRTNIVFDIAENTDVTLSVVDMTGRTVQTIIPGQRHSAGSYSIHWNGKTDDGVKAASGMYLLVLKAGSVRKTQKVMLVR